MSNLPSGTVTFLFTDIEGSTKLWEQHHDPMRDVIARHDALLQKTIEANGGYVFKTVGDAFCAAFSTATDALNASLTAQRTLQAEEWGEIGSLRIRIGLHTGAAQERDGDYFGPALNRVARLQSAAHGQQILLSQSTYELVRDHLPSDVELLDLGEHRLKDLIRPEHVFQVVAADLPLEFPPIRTLNARSNNLPIQHTPLVGREKEVTTVLDRLRNPQVRLLTLTGPGGVGKTRLGLQVAAELFDEFEDGVLFIDLAPINDPGLVVFEIMQTVGIRESGSLPMLEVLIHFLSDKKLLLLFDNFEQVAGAAPIIGQLITSALGLKVLVTSRVPLRVRGEKEFPVPYLTLPALKELPPIETLAQYEAVRLFIERATDVIPDFQLTNDNALSVAEICIRLDGLPLAIELAAARIRLLPPQAMLTRLQSRLKLLTGGARDLPARQQTLRNTIDWSYDLLEEGEKQLFKRMAVFQGGRTLESLEVVCNADKQLRIDALDGAELLVSKSLLRQEDGVGRKVGGEPRFVMLETIHEYAREKLEESGEGEELRRRYAEYFLELAERAEPELEGPQQMMWLDRLEDEYDNMRAVLRWSKDSGTARSVEIGLGLTGAIWRFWLIHGHLSEGRAQLGAMLAVGNEHNVGKARAKSFNGAGVLATLQGDYEVARSLFEESLEIRSDIGDKQGVATSLNSLGNLAWFQGSLQRALALFEESLGIWREIGDIKGIALALDNMGNVYGSLGEYEKAISLHEESLVTKRDLGDKFEISGSLNNLGIGYYSVGNYEKSRSLHEESLALKQDLGDKEGIAQSLHNLGNVAHKQGDYKKANLLHKESLELAHELSDRQGIAFCLDGLANAAGLEGKLERAARLWGAAEDLRNVIGAPLSPTDRIEFEQPFAAVRVGLSEEGWEKAWHEGQDMGMERAITYALERN